MMLRVTVLTQPLENLRPKHIYDALLIREIAANEIAVVESETETVVESQGHKLEQPEYVLDVIRQAGQGWVLCPQDRIQPH